MRNPTPLPQFKKGDKVKTPHGDMMVLYWRNVETTKGLHIQYHCVPLTKDGKLYQAKIRWADWNPKCRFKEDQLEPLNTHTNMQWPHTQKELQMQFEYLFKFRFNYLPGKRSKRVKTSTGSVTIRCPNSLDELRTAPHDSSLSVGLIKMIHTEIKPKVKGTITAIIITEIKLA